MIKSNPIYKAFVAIVGCVLLLALSSCSPVFGSTPTNQVILTTQEFTTLKSNFATLESTIDSQLNTITELEMQLTVAKLSTSESNNQLIEALKLIKEQRMQLTQAKISLEKQEQMLNEQRLSLEKAEIYLNEQKKEIHKAKMKQRNSTILNYVLGAALVYTVAKN